MREDDQAYEIVPGRGIGPFALGMTRDAIERLKIRPCRRFEDGRGAWFALVDVNEDELAGPRPGVTVSYDATGRCCEIQALFSYREEPPVFTLLGQVVNGMAHATATELLASIAADVTHSYGAVSSESAGVSAGRWEAGDDLIMSMTVRPKRSGG